MNEKITRRQLLAMASAMVAASTVPLGTKAQGAQGTVLVTGGSGYIGGWCIVELLRRGYTVRTTLRSLSKEKQVRAAVGSVVNAQDRLSFAVADLTKDAGWDAAVSGCDYVLHVASPLLGETSTTDVDALVAPARDGTLRVLRASSTAGVKRVVMTSAATVATPSMQSTDRVSDEHTWFDPNETVDAYRHSKRLAERAAWDFMANYRGPMTFATVLPSAVKGPILTSDSLGSTEIILRFLDGRIVASPRFALQIVDVRDLVDLHLRAMLAPNAAGERFLGVGEFLWMSQIAALLRANLGAAAGKVPTRTMPDWLYRTFALFDPQLRALTPRLGRTHQHTAAKAKRLLGWQPRPAAETIIDCARSLIEKKVFVPG